ncbi:hypothetical protein FACS1894102_7810 [Spirochaetia bacterium]|nr:hypothetical protein FACS1894102_7810 [Spirochaetia bacterium]
MKTTKKWSKMLLAGMSALVLTFGLVVAGCDDGSGDDGDGEQPVQDGLTITGIEDKYNGMYVFADANGEDVHLCSIESILGGDITKTKYYSVAVSGGTASVTLKAFNREEDGEETTFSVSDYTGSGTVEVSVELYSKFEDIDLLKDPNPDVKVKAKWNSVELIDGKATVVWDEATITP